jgi:hypothetical protein
MILIFKGSSFIMHINAKLSPSILDVILIKDFSL